MKELFIRKCPKCGSEILYKRKYDMLSADKKGSVCKLCRAKLIVLNRRSYLGSSNPYYGKKHTQKIKQKMVQGQSKFKMSVSPEAFRQSKSRDVLGNKNPMYGKTVYQVWVEKYGEKETKRKWEQLQSLKSIKMSGSGNPMYGKPSPKKSGNGWSGWYKGWYFRSLIEISYLLKEIESKGFEWESGEKHKYTILYNFDGKKRTYRPDFVVGRDVIECKPKALHSSRLVVAKTKAAKRFCSKRGLCYILVDYPKLTISEIEYLLSGGELKFTQRTSRRFDEFKNRKRTK